MLADGDGADEFARHLLALRDPAMRERLSRGASEAASALFSRARLDDAVNTLIETALTTM